MPNISIIKGDQLVTSSLAVGHPTTFVYDNDRLNVLDLSGSIIIRGSGSVPVSPVGAGIIFYDPSTQKLKVSENAGASANLVGAGNATGSVIGTGFDGGLAIWNDGNSLKADPNITWNGGTNYVTGNINIGGPGNLVVSGNTNTTTLTSSNGAFLSGSIILGKATPNTVIPTNGGSIYMDASSNLAVGINGAVQFQVGSGVFISGLAFQLDQSLRLPGGLPAAPSIFTQNGSTTGLYSGQTDMLMFSSQGLEKIRITPTGIGIGQISPSASLHVLGSMIVDTGPLTVNGSINTNNFNSTDGNFRSLTGSFITGSQILSNYITASTGLIVQGSLNVLNTVTASQINFGDSSVQTTAGAKGTNNGPQVGQNIFNGNTNNSTLTFRRLLGGTGISLLSGSDTVMISFTGSAGGLTSSAGRNLTSDAGLYAGNADAGTLLFRTLIPGAGINFVSSSTTLTLFTTITSSGQGGLTSSAGINSGSGQGIYKGNSDLGTLQFRTITSDNSINLISGSESLLLATTDWKQTGSILAPFTANTVNIPGTLLGTYGNFSSLTASFITGSQSIFNFVSASAGLFVGGNLNIAASITASNINSTTLNSVYGSHSSLTASFITGSQFIVRFLSGSSLSVSGSSNFAGPITASNIYLNNPGAQSAHILGLRQNDALLKILAGATEADGAALLMSGKNNAGSPFKGGAEYTIGNLAGSHFVVQSYDFASTWEYRFILNGDTGHTWLGITPQSAPNGTGLVAVGHPLGFTPTTTMDLSGTLTWRDLVVSPAVSSIHSARLYYDRNTEKLKISENGKAYVNIADITSSAGINLNPASNQGIYAGNADLGTLQFRSLIAGTNITFVSSSTDITINTTSQIATGSGMWNPTTSSFAFWNSTTTVTGSANFTLNNGSTVMIASASNGFFFSGSTLDLTTAINFDDVSSGSIFPVLSSNHIDDSFMWSDTNTSKMKIWEYRDPLASETIYPTGAAGNILAYPNKQGHGSWIKPVYIHTTGTYPNASINSLNDIPGLWVSLKPSKKYIFKFVIGYKSPITTANGIRIGLATGSWGSGIPSAPNGNIPIEYYATVITATGITGSIGSLTSLNRLNALGTGTYLSTTAVAVVGSTYQAIIQGYIQTGTGSINLSAIYASSVAGQQITVTSSYAEIDELNVIASG